MGCSRKYIKLIQIIEEINNDTNANKFRGSGQFWS
jgi:hypothetical protein